MFPHHVEAGLSSRVGALPVLSGDDLFNPPPMDLREVLPSLWIEQSSEDFERFAGRLEVIDTQGTKRVVEGAQSLAEPFCVVEGFVLPDLRGRPRLQCLRTVGQRSADLGG